MTTNKNVVGKIIITTAVFSLILLICIIFGIITGSADINIKKILIGLFTNRYDITNTDIAIILKIRLPRVITAALSGAVLSLGGLIFQAMLRNPLAEPYILGVSGGSAIGAIIGIALGFSYFPGVGLTAFAGSMASVAALILINSKNSSFKKDSLILSGVILNSFFSAIIMFLISVSNSAELKGILFWLMGDFSIINMKEVKILAALIFPAFIFFFFISSKMNLLALGKNMAKSMGVNIKAVVLSMLIVSSFMVSISVACSGLLGFVGLVIPHLLRLIIGADHRILVPASILGGGAYMVLCDILARTIPSAGGEIPVGVITALIGAPLFILLLKRNPAG
ncbi:MAG: iron ABC transporter permease [Deltaproteobacteria bacterium]|nr:iron ABC transporter permease [Deltaproteobacteria bacterium]